MVCFRVVRFHRVTVKIQGFGFLCVSWTLKEKNVEIHENRISEKVEVMGDGGLHQLHLKKTGLILQPHCDDRVYINNQLSFCHEVHQETTLALQRVENRLIETFSYKNVSALQNQTFEMKAKSM